MSKIKEWIIKRLGGVPSKALNYNDSVFKIYSTEIETLTASCIVSDYVYDLEFKFNEANNRIIEKLTKELVESIVNKKLYKFKVIFDKEHSLVSCRMDINISK